MISDLSCVILMRALLILSLHVTILIIGNTKLSLKNLVNLYMTALLDLSPLVVTYVLVVLLFILTINVPNSCFMLWMIIFRV
jgi:hypothetical protein